MKACHTSKWIEHARIIHFQIIFQTVPCSSNLLVNWYVFPKPFVVWLKCADPWIIFWIPTIRQHHSECHSLDKLIWISAKKQTNFINSPSCNSDYAANSVSCSILLYLHQSVSSSCLLLTQFNNAWERFHSLNIY